MSDGNASAPGAAPAAAPTQGAPTSTQQAEPKKPAPQQPAAPSWSEKDDIELLERIKRSPYAKLKVNGKEEGIESIEDLKRRNLDAMRGRGANRVVEETKKVAEEGRKAKEAFEQHSRLLERARRGDTSALRELGLVPDVERQRAQEEFDALPPALQQVVLQNQELAQRLAEKEAAEQKQLTERQQAEAEKAKRDVLERAKAVLPELMADIREEFMDVDLPDVLTVMESLRSEGARLGIDYDVSHIKTLVTQLREGGVDSRISQMKPAAAAKRLGPILATMKPSEMKAALGEHFMPIAKAISKAYVAAVRGERDKPITTAASEAPKPAVKPTPLSPFRWK